MRMRATHQENKETTLARAQAQQCPLPSAHATQPPGVTASLLNLQRTHGNRFVRQLLNTEGTTRQGCGYGQSSNSTEECTECREKTQKSHEESSLLPEDYAAAAILQQDSNTSDSSRRLSKTIAKLQQISLGTSGRWVVAASILHDQAAPIEERVALASAIKGVYGQAFLTRMSSLIPADQTLAAAMTFCEDEECRSAVGVEATGMETMGSDENTARIDERVVNRLGSTKDDGVPLGAATRMEMQSLLVANFAGVRIHANTHSAVVADALGVNAFTIGHDIFFAHGKYQPDTAQGRWTLGHELAHVVQQAGSAASLGTIGQRLNDTGLEHEADRAATAIAHGLPMLVTKHVATAALQGQRACVTRENIPENRGGIVNSGGRVNEYFEMNIDWEQPIPTTCECRCGEYRQYIKGYFKVNGVKLKKPLWGGADLEETVYHEDGDGAGTRYGHRSEPESTGDVYNNPNRATGCSFRGWDRPGVTGPAGTAVDFSLTFKGQTFDTCNNTFGAINEWTVSFSGNIA